MAENWQKPGDPMRIIVMGQQAFGKDALAKILEAGRDEVVAVYCEPDGRVSLSTRSRRLRWKTACRCISLQISMLRKPWTRWLPAMAT